MIADNTFYNGWQSFLHRFVTQTPLAATRQLSSPLAYMGAVTGIPTVNFDLAAITFTAGMAKRAGSVFAAAPIVQGGKYAPSVGDILTSGTGNFIASYFYSNLDLSQYTVVLWWTPEFSSGDTSIATALFYQLDSNNSLSYQYAGNRFLFGVSGHPSAYVWIRPVVAGTTYCIVARFDAKNTLDGTNKACLSIDDVSTFFPAGSATQRTPTTAFGIGCPYTGINTSPANAIIQGLTIYRRPLWDGAYGKDVGNGDEINQIWAAGAGKDPCLVTGSWDVVFCLPTNSTVGALVTGTGEAWSHPHESELLTDWYYGNKFYNNPWSILFNGTSTRINCGKTNGLDDLADNEFTFEAWINTSALISGTNYIADKNGWRLYLVSTGLGLRASIDCATTDAYSQVSLPTPTVGNYQHVVMYFNDAGDRKIYIAINGVWCTYAVQTAGIGAIVSDSSNNLMLGSVYSAAANFFKGSYGWTRISNNDRYNHGVNFTPSLTPPAPDANTVAQWNMSEGTGTTVDNVEGTASRDGTITTGTWTPEWITTGTPTTPAADLATAEKIYNWGWKFTAAADGDGIHQTKAGQTAGADFVLRCVAHSSDANPITVQVYDETNGALIKDFDFGASSTVTAPGIALFSFELPTIARGAVADCASFSVKIMGTAAGQVVYIHQCEML